jgi:hypothetical protein
MLSHSYMCIRNAQMCMRVMLTCVCVCNVHTLHVRMCALHTHGISYAGPVSCSHLIVVARIRTTSCAVESPCEACAKHWACSAASTGALQLIHAQVKSVLEYMAARLVRNVLIFCMQASDGLECCAVEHMILPRDELVRWIRVVLALIVAVCVVVLATIQVCFP